MKIDYHKSFQKAFKRLDRKLQNKVIERIRLFQSDVNYPLLKNHALIGSMKGKRAISVTGNVRIIFEEYEDYTLVVMLDVGGHSQVYGM
ncbi:type II toxin-antitoxin system mRNA interferase toxin, RelE/StbE family [Candidatus Peregrinibacteria bacterium]|nr:type II toxin-antitoxin system mRNA interferase toxin, RelE/StbE family [Candidatus Peregrinibacteria bacterium]MBT4631709.1 type II toxin-antitoxin system mRNA interferase toxin, RelE/StbE family [Candidatus Peregrinibacteria bacterium]